MKNFEFTIYCANLAKLVTGIDPQFLGDCVDGKFDICQNGWHLQVERKFKGILNIFLQRESLGDEKQLIISIHIDIESSGLWV